MNPNITITDRLAGLDSTWPVLLTEADTFRQQEDVDTGEWVDTDEVLGSSWKLCHTDPDTSEAQAVWVQTAVDDPPDFVDMQVQLGLDALLQSAGMDALIDNG